MFDDVEFDPSKSAANALKHGRRFEDFTGFDGAFAIVPDIRNGHGPEERFWAIGRIDGQGHVLVFTRRGDATRLISLRRAHEREMKRYGQ